MIGGIIVSHGRLAEELLNALTISLGEAPNIEAISVGWYDDVEDAKKKISQCLKRVDQKSGAVIFTDMFGGTPSNLSFSFLKENHVEIITGVNLPMLIKFVSLQRNNNPKDVDKKVDQADGKTIPAILTLAATQGTSIRLLVAGKDEEAAVAALVELIANRFDEKEGSGMAIQRRRGLGCSP